MSAAKHKFAFVGPCRTGKTLALNTIAHESLDQPTVSTVACSGHELQLAVDCVVYHLELLDTSGNPKFSILRRLYTFNADVLMLFCSVSRLDESAFDLHKKVREETQSCRVAIVVGTHVDGPIDEPSRSRVAEWAGANGLAYFDVDVFDEICLLDLLAYAVRRLRGD